MDCQNSMAAMAKCRTPSPLISPRIIVESRTTAQPIGNRINKTGQKSDQGLNKKNRPAYTR